MYDNKISLPVSCTQTTERGGWLVIDFLSTSSAAELAAVPGPSSRVALQISLGAGEEIIMPSEVKTMLFDVGGMKHAIETGSVSVCHHPVKVAY